MLLATFIRQLQVLAETDNVGPAAHVFFEPAQNWTEVQSTGWSGQIGGVILTSRPIAS